MPLLAGWATATWVALTMQGYWWPGRQLVVVLPLAVLVVLVWLARAGRAVLVRRPCSPSPGSATTPPLLVTGYVSDTTWVLAPDDLVLHWPAALLLPDDRDLAPADQVRYAAWVVVAVAPRSQRCSRCVPPAVPVERQRHPERHAEQVRGQHVVEQPGRHDQPVAQQQRRA